jgi:hypothetical protein
LETKGNFSRIFSTRQKIYKNWLVFNKHNVLLYLKKKSNFTHFLTTKLIILVSNVVALMHMVPFELKLSAGGAWFNFHAQLFF